MSHIIAPGPAGIWRLLVLSPDPTDPLWLIATVAPGGVRPAGPGPAVDDLTTAWVASASGLYRPALVPMPGALAWRVDEGGQPR